MENDSKLLPGPVLKGTREYIDHKMVVIEETLTVRNAAELNNFKKITLARCAKQDAIIAELENKLSDYERLLSELREASASSPVTPIEQREQAVERRHTEPEIRDLFLAFGHKIPRRNYFTGAQLADELGLLVTLRPSDYEKGYKGRIVWTDKVMQTLNNWTSRDGTGSYPECPFKKLKSRSEYAIKEGWQWPSQTA